MLALTFTWIRHWAHRWLCASALCSGSSWWLACTCSIAARRQRLSLVAIAISVIGYLLFVVASG